MNYIKEYYDKICSGEIVASRRIKAVYKRLVEDIESGRFAFDESRGSEPIYFIETFCKHSKAPFTNQPFKLELFQRAKIQAAYGFLNPNGSRRFREVFDYRARKNGKTTELAGLSLYHLVGDCEGGAEVYSVATKLDQAKRTFEEACNMVRQSKELSKVLKKRKTDLYFSPTFSVLKPLSSDSNTLDGLNSSFVVIDECHAIKDRQLYNVMKRSTSTRKQAMLMTITTAGMVRGSIFDELYEYATKVADGTVVDDEFLPLLYELDHREEYLNTRMWMKANPALYAIKEFSYLEKQVERARSNPSELRSLLCYEFNQIETSNESWLSYDEIDSNLTFDIDDLRDTYAIGGADLSAVRDLSAATLIIKKRDDDMLYVLQHYWLPRSRVEEVEQMEHQEAPYRLWAEQGLLTICDGTMVDYNQVTGWFIEMRDKYQIDLFKLGYDRALAGMWIQQMAGEFSENSMEKVAQGPFTWSTPMKQLGSLIADKKINYNKNKILKWCLMNTAVKTTGTLDVIQPVKITASRRIDGLVSLLNAYCAYVKYEDDYLNLVG